MFTLRSNKMANDRSMHTHKHVSTCFDKCRLMKGSLTYMIMNNQLFDIWCKQNDCFHSIMDQNYLVSHVLWSTFYNNYFYFCFIFLIEIYRKPASQNCLQLAYRIHWKYYELRTRLQ